MSDKLNIPNDQTPNPSPPKLVLPNEDQLKRAFVPKFSIGNIDPFTPVKSASADLIIKSFGLQLLQTEIYRGKIPIAIRDKSDITRKSALGTNIFSDLQFKTVDALGPMIPVDVALFSNVGQDKSIVRTTVNGRDGQIKQYLGLDDYVINIKGVLDGTNGVYPWDAVKNLVNYLRYEQSLGIVSRYLNEIFDINEIVVKDYAFEQSEGSQSYQKFEINCWSDEPVEILIQEGK